MIVLKKEELENTYLCSVCGEMHPNSSMCPVMQEKLENARSKKYISYFWLNVAAMCLSQEISLSDIVNKVSYLENYYNHWNKKHNLPIDVFIEDIVSYISYELDCTPKQLFQPTDIELFLNILKENFNFRCEIASEYDLKNTDDSVKVKYMFRFNEPNRLSSANNDLIFYLYKYNESANKHFYGINIDFSFKTFKGLVPISCFNMYPLDVSCSINDEQIYAEKNGVLSNYIESLINENWDDFSTKYNYLKTNKYNSLIFYDFLRAVQNQNVYVKKAQKRIIFYDGEFKLYNNNSYHVCPFSLEIYDKTKPDTVFHNGYCCGKVKL